MNKFDIDKLMDEYKNRIKWTDFEFINRVIDPFIKVDTFEDISLAMYSRKYGIVAVWNSEILNKKHLKFVESTYTMYSTLEFKLPPSPEEIVYTDEFALVFIKNFKIIGHINVNSIISLIISSHLPGLNYDVDRISSFSPFL